MTKQLPHIKMGRNPPKLKILGGCLLQIALTRKKKSIIRYIILKRKYYLIFGLKEQYRHSERDILKTLILSKVVQLRILLPNLPDGFIATP